MLSTIAISSNAKPSSGVINHAVIIPVINSALNSTFTLGYEISTPVVGNSISMVLDFSNSIPAGAVLYQVDFFGNYNEIPDTQWRVTKDGDVELTMLDGGAFDVDGLANGKIACRFAIGMPQAQVSPVPAPVPTSVVYKPSQDGGGSLSPLLLAMLWLVNFYVASRRRGVRK